MRKINIHEAKTHLSKLVEEAAEGDRFIIAKAGRPIAQVGPVEDALDAPPRRLGFLAGAFEVPEDFDELGSEEIARLFGSE